MNVYALLTGRGGSKSPPKKNIRPVLGKPLMAHPLMAAKLSKVDDVYLTTDSQEIAEIGKQYGAKIIWRPPELCTDTAEHEGVIVHGYKYMVEKLQLQVDIIVMLMCNCATITAKTINNGIDILENNPEADSCVTVSEYSEHNVARAMKIEEGRLRPFINPDLLRGSTSNRNSLGKTYFCDGGAWIFRARCMDLKGKPPYRWMGKNIVPLIQQDGLDVDNEKGLVLTEYWLKKYG